jgi:ABC-type spermidine/putrescine transport system permease subunit II
MTEAGGGWRGLVVVTLAVYLFLFAPLATTALLAFNGSSSAAFRCTVSRCIGSPSYRTIAS